MAILCGPVRLPPMCNICGRARATTGKTCAPCSAVAPTIRTYNDLLFLIVDGSFRSRFAGAGLVLVRGNLTGPMVASRRCCFVAEDSIQAEYEAIVRGRMWAPNVWTYSDCVDAIRLAREHMPNVRWI